jgi:hypothetical protein
MALAWWGQVVNINNQHEPDTGKFLEAVEDVHWVLKQILSGFACKPMKKHLAENDEPSGSNKRYVYHLVFINDS